MQGIDASAFLLSCDANPSHLRAVVLLDVQGTGDKETDAAEIVRNRALVAALSDVQFVLQTEFNEDTLTAMAHGRLALLESLLAEPSAATAKQAMAAMFSCRQAGQVIILHRGKNSYRDEEGFLHKFRNPDQSLNASTWAQWNGALTEQLLEVQDTDSGRAAATRHMLRMSSTNVQLVHLPSAGEDEELDEPATMAPAYLEALHHTLSKAFSSPGLTWISLSDMNKRLETAQAILDKPRALFEQYLDAAAQADVVTTAERTLVARTAVNALSSAQLVLIQMNGLKAASDAFQDGSDQCDREELEQQLVNTGLASTQVEASKMVITAGTTASLEAFAAALLGQSIKDQYHSEYAAAALAACEVQPSLEVAASADVDLKISKRRAAAASDAMSAMHRMMDSPMGTAALVAVLTPTVLFALQEGAGAVHWAALKEILQAKKGMEFHRLEAARAKAAALAQAARQRAEARRAEEEAHKAADEQRAEMAREQQTRERARQRDAAKESAQRTMWWAVGAWSLGAAGAAVGAPALAAAGATVFVFSCIRGAAELMTAP